MTDLDAGAWSRYVAHDLKRLRDDLTDIRMQLARLPGPQSAHRVQAEVAALRRDMATPRVEVPAWMAHASTEELRLIAEVARDETAALNRERRALVLRSHAVRQALAVALGVLCGWAIYAATGL